MLKLILICFLTIIENIIGKQHFKPVEFFGGQKAFELLQKCDKIKNNYCNTNNIPLLRVNYFQIEEEIILIVKQFIMDQTYGLSMLFG